jgi:hypothetical protein
VLEGVTEAILEDPGAGLARTLRGIALYREHPTPPIFWPTLLTLRAAATALAGQFDEALAVLDEAAVLAAERLLDLTAIEVQRGEILAGLGDRAGAEAALRHALETGAASGARALQLMAAPLLAQVSDEGRRTAAAALRQLLPTLTEGLDSPLVQGARQVLDAELSRADA